jgi:hypothetical protein
MEENVGARLHRIGVVGGLIEGQRGPIEVGRHDKRLT